MSILQSFTFQELKNLLPNRAKDSHKGNFGKVLICAGSPGMGGAGILASEASLFCGSGLVTLVTDTSNVSSSLLRNPEVYIDWREKEIIFPFQSGYHAIHFDARDFAEMGLKRLQKMYSNYRRVDANVEYKDLTEYDYVIDCRGRPTDFSDYEECNLVLNSALVYDDPTPSDFGFTKHVAHKYGWMFVIPLQHRTSHGFLYNNEFCTRKEAEDELIRITEASDDDRSNFRTFDLKPYYCKKTIDGKILKSGNRAVFFEPMSANSLYMTVKNVEIHSQYIRGEITQDKANELCILNYRAVEDLINLIYHGGSIYENEFWDWAKETSSKRIEQTDVLKRYVANQDDEMFKTITERFMGHHVLRYVDKEFEFGYFDD